MEKSNRYPRIFAYAALCGIFIVLTAQANNGVIIDHDIVMLIAREVLIPWIKQLLFSQ